MTKGAHAVRFWHPGWDSAEPEFLEYIIPKAKDLLGLPKDAKGDLVFHADTSDENSFWVSFRHHPNAPTSTDSSSDRSEGGK